MVTSVVLTFARVAELTSRYPLVVSLLITILMKEGSWVLAIVGLVGQAGVIARAKSTE